MVEVAPAQNLELDLSVIRSRGTIAIYANNGGDEVPLSVRQTFSTNVRLQFVYLYPSAPRPSRTPRRGRDRRRA